MHCPREEGAVVRAPRGLLGGVVPADTDRLARAVVAVLVVVGLATTVGPGLVGTLGLVPGLVPAQPWRLLTSVLVHAGLLHLTLNALALLTVLPGVEAALGRARTVATGGLGALGGSVAVLVASPERSLTVGASGGVLALLGALAVVGRVRAREGRRSGDGDRLLLWVVGLLVLSVVVPRVSLAGHLGGLLTGAALAAGWAALPPAARRTRSGGAVPVIGVALVLITVLLLVNAGAPLAR